MKREELVTLVAKELAYQFHCGGGSVEDYLESAGSVVHLIERVKTRETAKEAYYTGYECGLNKEPPWFSKWYDDRS